MRCEPTPRRAASDYREIIENANKKTQEHEQPSDKPNNRPPHQNQGRVTPINPPHGLRTAPAVQNLARPPTGGSRPRASRRPSVGRHRDRSRTDPFRDRRLRRGGPDTITPRYKTAQPSAQNHATLQIRDVRRRPVFQWRVTTLRPLMRRVSDGCPALVAENALARTYISRWSGRGDLG